MSMPVAVAADPSSNGHVWLAAVTIPVPDEQAAAVAAGQRLVVSKPSALRVEDVYCARCRRSASRAGDQPCQVKGNGNFTAEFLGDTHGNVRPKTRRRGLLN